MLHLTTSPGGTTAEPERGAPGGILQAAETRSATVESAASIAPRFIVGGSPRSSRPFLLALQSRREQQKEGIAKYVRALGGKLRRRQRRRIRSEKRQTRPSRSARSEE